jgi:hypothetical protein
MLAFWWYASTCRHLGIGGVSDPAHPIYRALKSAVTTYHRLKRFYTQGEFIGIDLFAHAHVLKDSQAAVVNLFNLTSKPIKRTIRFSPEKLGLDAIASVSCGGAAAESTGDGSEFVFEIPPMSPLLVEIN